MTGALAHKLGVCQWFDFAAYSDVKRALVELRALGVRHLRTGISWAEHEQPGGAAWYDWLFDQLAGFELMVCIARTPPRLTERGTPSSPPRCPDDYAAFVGAMIERYGHRFSDIELWNAPTSLYWWDFEACDPDWSKLAAMIASASATARRHGKRTVLGGMLPVDHHWLTLMRDHGALEHIDVVAIQGFPEMWWNDAPCWDSKGSWRGWDDKIAYIRAYTGGRQVWVTETGLATWDPRVERTGRFRLQAELLQRAARAPAERVYWRGLLDQDPARATAWGFHVDENEYHLGLVSWQGDRKPAWGILKHLLAGAHTRPLTQPQPVDELPRL